MSVSATRLSNCSHKVRPMPRLIPEWIADRTIACLTSQWTQAWPLSWLVITESLRSPLEPL
jgi:hypothetical protein